MKRFAAVIVWSVLIIVGCDGNREMPAESQTPSDRMEQRAAVAPEAARPDTSPAIETIAAVESPASTGTLTVSFETTAPTGGKYADKNVHVVWVEKADGTFVKTLSLWADRRARHLALWAAATTDRAKDVQARTGATLTAYGTYTSSWDGTDASGKPMPDGDYVIRLELTNDNADKNKFHRATVNFTKTGESQTQDPKDENGYKQITLDWKPE